MKLHQLPPSLSAPQFRAKAQQPPSEPGSKGDGFEPSPPTPPIWKKALNTVACAGGGGIAGAAIATLVLGSTIQGSAALAAFLVGPAIGGPVGAIAGAVVGWKNCGGENPSVGRKLANAALWGAAGAAAGAFAAVGIGASMVSGPAALGAFLLAAPGAAVGTAVAGAVGWQMTKG